MANGYIGRILRLNLATQAASTIDTRKYEEWGGGNGIATAIFWDLCTNKAIPGTDPRNVVCLMTGPLAGTAAPSTGRIELTGIGLQAYPYDWFTRSNFGGRFAVMLKAAGWDGIVIEGRANALCWVKVVNDTVTFEDAKNLQGLDTWETQMDIWSGTVGSRRFGEWLPLEKGYTTQRPAVLCIGPAGENMSRVASLIHDAADASGQCGFGGVFGAKNLKAIAVLGTGSVEIADPHALMDARLWLNSKVKAVQAGPATNPNFRAAGCQSCPVPCRQRSGSGNDSQCIETYWYAGRSLPVANPRFPGKMAKRATDLIQRYGINAAEGIGAHQYLKALYDMKVLTPSMAAPLAMASYGTLGFAEEYLRAITAKDGIGADLAEGAPRAAKKWGRLDEDLDSGILNYPQWGQFFHNTLPGVEWAFGSLLSDRDINEHGLQKTYLTLFTQKGLADQYPAEKFVEVMAQKLIPYAGDPYAFDYGDGPTGIYSEHKAKLVAWDRHYGRFWKQSVLYCDQSQLFPSFIENQKTTYGFTPEAEPRFFNAVTGRNVTFEQGMEIGRRIWNLTRAIWVLQGRHRDDEKFAGFMFKPGAAYGGCGTTTTKIGVVGPAPLGFYPVYENGKWRYDELKEMVLTREGVEAFKTHYFNVEGWDEQTGWPRRSTLESMNLKEVADALAAQGKLGVEAPRRIA
jgi:aldehyde:ferredoxin oxidoreductase